MYDDLLNQRLPADSTVIGFADDVVIVVTARDTSTLEVLTSEALRRVRNWMSQNGLDLALHKIEAVLITDRRKFDPPVIKLDDQKVSLRDSLRYLGVQLDRGLKFKEQVANAAEKAATTAVALARLMPNIAGPTDAKRKLLISVVHSKTLYGAEIWAGALSKVGNRRKLARVQRTCALRAICAFRTVSTEAASVLAGIPPIDLLALEKQEIYRELQRHDAGHGRDQQRRNIKKQARDRLLQRWQGRDSRWPLDV